MENSYAIFQIKGVLSFQRFLLRLENQYTILEVQLRSVSYTLIARICKISSKISRFGSVV